MYNLLYSIHIFIVINRGCSYAANIDIAEKCKLMQPMKLHDLKNLYIAAIIAVTIAI
jgi:hypothetical protein